MSLNQPRTGVTSDKQPAQESVHAPTCLHLRVKRIHRCTVRAPASVFINCDWFKVRVRH